MSDQPNPFAHLTITGEAHVKATRRARIESAIAPFVTRRLAGAWSHGRYRDFREGIVSPAEVAAESDEGLAEVLDYIRRVGPSVKGTDWSGSGWVGKGRKKPPKRP